MRATVLRTEDGPEDEQKARYVAELGKATVAAIGNGRNDRLMLREAALGIAVIGPEGTAGDAVRAAKVVAADPLTALTCCFIRFD
jgi:soluble P-type ATPase